MLEVVKPAPVQLEGSGADPWDTLSPEATLSPPGLFQQTAPRPRMESPLLHPQGPCVGAPLSPGGPAWGFLSHPRAPYFGSFPLPPGALWGSPLSLGGGLTWRLLPTRSFWAQMFTEGYKGLPVAA